VCVCVSETTLPRSEDEMIRIKQLFPIFPNARYQEYLNRIDAVNYFDEDTSVIPSGCWINCQG
jgi:hypothetical protein